MIDSGIVKREMPGRKAEKGKAAKISSPFAESISHDAAVDALRAADAAWLEAYRAKDATLAAAFYSPQGAMLAPNAPARKGKNILTKFIASSFTLPGYNIFWRCQKVEVARSGELGYTSGAYRMSYRNASGKKVSDRGKYLMVWKKQRTGEWKVLFDISNSDLPR